MPPPPLLLLPGAPSLRPASALALLAATPPTDPRAAPAAAAPARVRLARLRVLGHPPASCRRSSSTPTPFSEPARGPRDYLGAFTSPPGAEKHPSTAPAGLIRRGALDLPSVPALAGRHTQPSQRLPATTSASTPPAPTTRPRAASTLDHRATRPHSARPTSDTTTSIDPHDASRALAPPPPTSRAPRRLRAPHPASEPPRGRPTNSA